MKDAAYQLLVQSVTTRFTGKRKSPEFTAHVFIEADSYKNPEAGSLLSNHLHFTGDTVIHKAKGCQVEMPGPEPKSTGLTPGDLCSDRQVRATECGRGLDPEVEKRPEQRPTPATTHRSLGPELQPRLLNHSPAAWREEVGVIFVSGPEHPVGFSWAEGRKSVFPGPVTTDVVNCRSRELLSGRKTLSR